MFGEAPTAEPSQMDHGSWVTEKARFYAPALERFARKAEESARKS
jgi:hypothetical protein